MGPYLRPLAWTMYVLALYATLCQFPSLTLTPNDTYTVMQRAGTFSSGENTFLSWVHIEQMMSVAAWQVDTMQKEIGREEGRGIVLWGVVVRVGEGA